jgi:hypothetical protein
MVDLPLTNAPGYIVKASDHPNDDLARFFIVCGAANGEEAALWVCEKVPEQSCEAVRNATEMEVDGMKAGDFRAILVTQALVR